MEEVVTELQQVREKRMEGNILSHQTECGWDFSLFMTTKMLVEVYYVTTIKY